MRIIQNFVNKKSSERRGLEPDKIHIYSFELVVRQVPISKGHPGGGGFVNSILSNLSTFKIFIECLQAQFWGP